MNIGKYETLMAVVEYGSLTRAAQSLGCTQSAVSHSIDSLEQELGFALLREAGREAGAAMVCFGHTHQALNERSGVWLFNPGTIGGPYGQRTSYGVIRAEGGTLWATIKDTGTG